MLSGLGVDSDANKKEEASNVFTLLTSLAEMKRFELLRRFEADLPHFEGRETDKTPYISAQVRIKYVPKACKKGLFSYLVICVRMTLQLHFSRPGTIWAPRAPFRTRRTHE